MSISMVIPTYKREDSLKRLLDSVLLQNQLPTEIFIVLPFNNELNQEMLDIYTSRLKINVLHCELGVCFQRNKGIKAANEEFIFLCDDDLVLEKEYISSLYSYLSKHRETIICSGQFLEKTEDNWSTSFPPKTWINFYFKKFFNHGIWASIEDLNKIKGPNFVLRQLMDYYAKRDNTYSKAGWPLHVMQNNEVNESKFYSLGASLCRSSFLKSHLFDEVLDPSGIGDNYGIALQLNQEMGIHVLKQPQAYHFKSPQNRLKNSIAYKRRVLAMNYFIEKYPGKVSSNTHNLIWSVFGNLISRLLTLQFSMVYSSISTLWNLTFGRNPYIEYDKKGLKSCKI